MNQQREPSPYWHLPSGPERNAMREAYYYQLNDRTDKLVRLCERHGVPLPIGMTASRGTNGRLNLHFGKRTEAIRPKYITEGILKTYFDFLTRPTQAPAASSETIGAARQ